MNNSLYHGGALDDAIAQYGGEADDWLDLSTGINPYAYPITNISDLSWTQLPQRLAIDNLIKAAQIAYNCEGRELIVANGTQIFIENLPRILAKSSIAIVSPTYEEHSHNWKKCGHEVFCIENLDEASKAEHLLIVNPNNPTGKLYTPEQLYQCAKRQKGMLIIDEAFMDITPEMSMAAAKLDNLIILRSFGKFFGLGGARIGFMLANPMLLNKMQSYIALWAVSGASIDVATQALSDLIWQTNMRKKLKSDMQNMQDVLIENKFKIIGSTHLFCLVFTPHAHKYFDKLANKHILVRKFSQNPTILRFGLATPKRLPHLAQVLNSINLELNL